MTDVHCIRGDFSESLENFVNHIDGSTQTEQIFVVINDAFWWRLYWNPKFQNWSVTCYAGGEWQESFEFNTQDLIPKIMERKMLLQNARGFEHKTPTGVIVYTGKHRPRKD